MYGNGWRYFGKCQQTGKERESQRQAGLVVTFDYSVVAGTEDGRRLGFEVANALHYLALHICLNVS
jgi:hypothetical protein